jgi:cytoskeletal protein CcmA (bactofilin family)
MAHILSGFLFPHKKDMETGEHKTGAVSRPDSSGPRAAQSDTSSKDRSQPMRLTKSEPTPSFEEKTIPDIGFGPRIGDNRTDLARGKTPIAVIGPKIIFKGELSGEEDLLIQGRVEGKIDLKGHHLTIGSQGVIKANVSAKTITIEGAIEGDVVAAEHIAVKSGSRVNGNLKAERVTLEDGAKFRGAIDMDVEPQAKQDANRVAQTSAISGNKPAFNG